LKVKCGGSAKDSSSKKRKNCIERKTSPVKLVLREDIKMHELVKTTLQVLLGRFHGLQIGKASLREWLKAKWAPRIGYLSKKILLALGWMGFLFKKSEDMKRVMEMH
jgi:hypothetical protein